MRLDNKDLETNAQKSISTLEKLKTALDFSKAGKGIDGIEKSVNNLDFSKITSSVEQLNSRFSTFGVAGMQVISNLTNAAINLGSTLVHKVIDPIATGGWARASNIAQAKFQLEGLGIAWEQISDDIDYGVKDTAYGLDAAAKVASQLVASGVQLGDQMKADLRAISGVAAMTNSTYEEIGHIFTTVAGQGKLMTMQLNQLAGRGLNVASKLGEELGKSEAEIREMVTKGEIDFQTFASAMDSAFGEHAKEANRTFTGSLANMKAGLSRIGANFATSFQDNMIDVYNTLKDIINNINKSKLGTLYKDFDNFAKKASKFVTGTLKKMDFKWVDKLVDSLHKAYTWFDKIMGKVSPLWDSTVEDVVEGEEKMTEGMEELEAVANRVIAGEFGNGEERWGLLQQLGYIPEQIQNMVNEMLGNSYRYEEVQEEMVETAEATAEAMADVVNSNEWLNDKANEVISGAYGNGEERRQALEEEGYYYEQVQNKVNELLGDMYRYELEADRITEQESKWGKVQGSLETTADKVAAAILGAKDALGILNDMFTAIKSGAAEPLQRIFESLSGAALTLAGNLGLNISELRQSLKDSDFYANVENNVNGALTAVADFVDVVVHDGTVAFTYLYKILSKLFGLFGDIKDKVVEFIDAFKETKGYEILSGWIEKLTGGLISLKDSALGGVQGALDSFLGLDFKIDEIDVAGFAQSLGEKIEWLSEKIEWFKTHVLDFFLSIDSNGIISTVTTLFSGLGEAIASFFSSLFSFSGEGTGPIEGAISFIGGAVESISSIVSGFDADSILSGLNSARMATGEFFLNFFSGIFGTEVSAAENDSEENISLIGKLLNKASEQFSDSEGVVDTIVSIVSYIANAIAGINIGDVVSNVNSFGEKANEIVQGILTDGIYVAVTGKKKKEKSVLDFAVEHYDDAKAAVEKLRELSPDKIVSDAAGLLASGTEKLFGLLNSNPMIGESIVDIGGFFFGDFIVQTIEQWAEEGRESRRLAKESIEHSFFDDIGLYATSFFENFKEGIANIFTLIFRNADNAITNFFKDTPAEELANGFIGYFKLILMRFLLLIRNIATALLPIVHAVYVVMKEVGLFVINTAAVAISNFILWIEERSPAVFKSLGTNLVNAFSKVFTLGGDRSNIFLAIIDFVKNTIGDIADWFKSDEVQSAISGAISTAKTNVKGFIKKVYNAIKDFFINAYNGIRNLNFGDILNLPNKISGIRKVINDYIVGYLKNLWATLTNFEGYELPDDAPSKVFLRFIGSTISSLGTFVSNVGQNIAKAISNLPFGEIFEAGKSLASSIFGNLTLALTNITFSDVVDAAGTAIQTIANGLMYAFRVITGQTVQAAELTDEEKEALNPNKTIGQMITEAADNLPEGDIVNTVTKRMGPILGGMVDAVVNGWTGVFSSINEALSKEDESGETKNIFERIYDFFVNLIDSLPSLDEILDNIQRFEKIIVSIISPLIGLGTGLAFKNLINSFSTAIAGLNPTRAGLKPAMSENVKNFGDAIWNIAKSFGVIATAFFVLSSLDDAQIMQGLKVTAIITGALAIILLLLSRFAKTKTVNTNPIASSISNAINNLKVPIKQFLKTFGTASLIGAITFAVIGLSGLIIKLKDIPWYAAKNSLKIMAAVLAELAIATIAITRFGGEHTSFSSALSIVAIALGVRLIVGALAKLNELDYKKTMKSVKAIAVIMLSLGAFSFLNSAEKFGYKNKGGFLKTLALMGLLFEVFYVIKDLSKIDTAKTESITSGLTKVIGSLALLMLAVDINIGQNVDWKTIAAKYGGMMLVLGELGGLFYMLRDIDTTNIVPLAESMSQVLNSLGWITFATGIGHQPATLEETGASLAWITGVTAIVGAIIGLLGLIEDFTGGGVSSFISTDVAPVLQAIGEAIGGFLGGILNKALFEPLNLATGLETFSEGISSVVDCVQQIVDKCAGLTDVTGINNLIDLCLKLVGTSFLAAVTDILDFRGLVTKKTTIQMFGDDLVSFAEAMNKFAEKTEGLTGDKVAGAVTAGEMLTGLAQKMPAGNSVLKFLITGNNSISGFAKQLEPLADGLVAFDDKVKGHTFDTDIASKAVTIGETIAGLNEKIPNTSQWSLLTALIGDNRLDVFGSQLPALGAGLVAFDNAITGHTFDKGLAKKAVFVGKCIAGLASVIPNEGGVLGWIVGENSMSEFANKLPALGAGLVAFDNEIKDHTFDTDLVKKAVNVGKAVAGLASVIPNEGGVLGWIVGENNMSKFGSRMEKLAEGIVAFDEKISAHGSFDQDLVDNAVTVAKTVAALDSQLPNEGGFLGWLAGGNDIGSFGEKLGPLGEGIAAFDTAVANVAFDKTQLAIEKFTALLDQINVLFNLHDFINKKASKDIDKLSEVVKRFFEKIDWADDDFNFKPENMSTIAQKLLEAVGKNLENPYISTADYSAFADSFNSAVSYALGATANKDEDDSVTQAARTKGEAIINAILSAAEEAINNDNNGATFKSALERFVTKCANIIISDSSKTKYKNKVISALNYIATVLTENVTIVTDAIATVCSEAINKIDESYESFKTAGINSITGYANGIVEGQSEAIAAAEGAANASLDALNNALIIKSPSKAFERSGIYGMQGLGRGFDKGSTYAEDAVENVAGIMLDDVDSLRDKTEQGALTILDSVRAVYGYIAKVITETIDLSPRITPVLDLSNIQNGVRDIDGMVGNGYMFGNNYARSMFPGSYAYETSYNAMNQADVINAITSIKGDIQYLGESISQMQMVLNTGVLVGSISGGVDQSLGQIQKFKERWA